MTLSKRLANQSLPLLSGGALLHLIVELSPCESVLAAGSITPLNLLLNHKVTCWKAKMTGSLIYIDHVPLFDGV